MTHSKKIGPNRKVILSNILILTLLVSMTQCGDSFQIQKIKSNSSNRDRQSSDFSGIIRHHIFNDLVDHPAISIRSDEDFNNYSFEGSGTQENPYRIENLNITVTEDIGIHVFRTTKFFVIQNCFVTSRFTGVHIQDVANGTAKLINNTISYSIKSIYILDSMYSTVINNYCEYTRDGVEILYSDYSTVENNTFTGNAIAGLTMRDSCYCKINNNAFLYNDDGMQISGANYSTITNNVITGSEGRGMDVTGGFSSLIENNSFSNNLKGLYLLGSKNTIIRENVFTNNSYGLTLGPSLFSVGNIEINGNIFENDGITIGGSSVYDFSHYEFNDNIINGKPFGFFIDLNSQTISAPYGQLFLINCTDITIEKQSISNTPIALFLFDCDRLLLINNNFSNNKLYGIKLRSCENSLIINNSISGNEEDGIYSAYSSNSWILYNSFVNNSKYGVHVGGTKYFIHHNNFLGNNLQGDSQGISDGEAIFWFDVETSFGNHWSDWIGEGTYMIDKGGYYEACGDLFPSSSIIAPYSGTIVLPWTKTSTSPSSYAIFFVLFYLLLTPTINRIRKREK